MFSPFIHSRVMPTALICLSVLVGTSSAFAQRAQDNLKQTPKLLSVFKPVVAPVLYSTVTVLEDGKEKAIGTIVDSDGFIITKASELKDGKITCKLRNGDQHDAKLIATHEPLDLAMLKIDRTELVPVSWATSKVAQVGNWVACVGRSEEPVCVGVVSVATRNMPFFRTPPLDPATGSGFLGLQPLPAEGGVKIGSVNPGSAAEKAGLKIGDIVTHINGKPIPDPETMIATVSSFKGGDKIVITIERDNRCIEITATLDKRPADPGRARSDFQNKMGSELSERRDYFPTFIQFDAVIKPSECGGPLVDLDGRVLGITVARAGRTESYAIPSEAIFPVLSDLMKGKSVLFRDLNNRPQTIEEAKTALERAEEEAKAVARKIADLKAALARLEAIQKKLKQPEKLTAPPTIEK